MEKVIVTGAEEHQGLAVIRGLGLAGVPVVACGSKPRSIGFYSRFAGERACYCSPFQDQAGFVDGILEIARRTGARLVIPSVESTLVALDGRRDQVEKCCALASPPSRVLECAIDKWKTVALARAVGVPVPDTRLFASPEQLGLAAEELAYPVAVKPRGSCLHPATVHHLGFKSKYARNPRQLRLLAAGLPRGGGNLLAQQYVAGQGVCVATVADRGRLVAAFAYERTREWPLTGGVSVLRRSLPLEDELRQYLDKLLGSLSWHGVAMVEFKRRPGGGYVLMEINGRFQASTALSLDAGLNLPYLVYQLYTGQPVVPVTEYRCGVRERWLRGDWLSFLEYMSGRTQAHAVNPRSLPSRLRVALEFVRSFGPGTRYDEFKLWDPKPGAAEFAEITKASWFYARGCAGRKWRTFRISREPAPAGNPSPTRTPVAPSSPPPAATALLLVPRSKDAAEGGKGGDKIAIAKASPGQAAKGVVALLGPR